MTLTPEQRERQAKREAGRTLCSPGVKLLLCICFIAFALGGAFCRLAQDLRDEPDTWPRTLDPARFLPAWEEIHGVTIDKGWFAALRLANQRILFNITECETDLKDGSPLVRTLIPPTNWLVTNVLRGSTESVYPGLDDWLFYRPDVTYITSKGFWIPSPWVHGAETHRV